MEEQLVSYKVLNLIPQKVLQSGVFKGVITQSLLQKWLRDIHGIVVTPHIDLRQVDKWIIEIQFMRKHFPNKGIMNEFHRDLNNSYEEALEIGLEKGLLLIKNK